MKLGGQVRYRLVDVESSEREKLEVFGAGQNTSKALITRHFLPMLVWLIVLVAVLFVVRMPIHIHSPTPIIKEKR